MDFFVREAAERDYDGLCELFAEADRLHRDALPKVFREPDGVARSESFVLEILENEGAALFVAERDAQLIGLVHVCIREARDIPILAPRRYAVIDGLVVKEAHRRSGVGTALAQRSHQWALDKGASQIELNVWEFNKNAIEFYEKLGYETASRKMWRSLKDKV